MTIAYDGIERNVGPAGVGVGVGLKLIATGGELARMFMPATTEAEPIATSVNTGMSSRKRSPIDFLRRSMPGVCGSRGRVVEIAGYAAAGRRGRLRT